GDARLGHREWLSRSFTTGISNDLKTDFPPCFQGVWSGFEIVSKSRDEAGGRSPFEHPVIDSAGTTPPDPGMVKRRTGASVFFLPFLVRLYPAPAATLFQHSFFGSGVSVSSAALLAASPGEGSMGL